MVTISCHLNLTGFLKMSNQPIDKLPFVITGYRDAHFVLGDADELNNALDTFETELKKLEEKQAKHSEIAKRIKSLEIRVDKLFLYEDEIKTIGSNILTKFIKIPQKQPEVKSVWSGYISLMVTLSTYNGSSESIEKIKESVTEFIKQLGFTPQSSQEITLRLSGDMLKVREKEAKLGNTTAEFIPFLISHCVQNKVFPKLMIGYGRKFTDMLLSITEESTDDESVKEKKNDIYHCLSLLEEVPMLYVNALPEEEKEAGLKQLKEFQEEEKRMLEELETPSGKECFNTLKQMFGKAFGKGKTTEDGNNHSSSTEV